MRFWLDTARNFLGMFRLWELAAILTLSALVAWVSTAQAAERRVTYAELVTLAMHYASEYTGYPIPETPPIIQRVSREWIVEHVCRGDAEHCVVGGWHSNGVIYLLEGLPDDALMRRAVHEGVHHLQYIHTGRGPSTCEENAQREGEAYRAEALFTTVVQHQPWKRSGILAKGCP